MPHAACVLLIALPALAEWTVRSGSEPITANVARELDYRALELFEEGRYEEAAAQQKRVLEIWSRIPQNDPADLAAAHFNLARSYLVLGKLTAADRHAQTARQLAGDSSTLEERGRITVLVAHIHFQSGEYADSERELRTAPPHLKELHRATAFNDLAMTRAALGDLRTARQLLEDSLAIRERTTAVGGPDHARVLSNLALICFRQDEVSSAAALYSRAIPMFQSAPGLSQIHAGMALVEYALVLRKSGRKSEAKDAERRAKAILGDSLRAPTPTIDVRSFR